MNLVAITLVGVFGIALLACGLLCSALYRKFDTGSMR